ncbi:MAG: NAD(P)-dependent alcohol dehydrogenase [Gammaproteobacteria bacterium]|nr:NAD(P)-dependent alcohol dehydrogenase [Gammaproteobacteria bacterium]
MKAIVFTKYGLADDLQFNDVEKPAPEDNEILIKVHAASINSWDWELLNGTPFVNRMMFGLFRPKKINILGFDVAGRIEAVGENVKQFKSGDEVFGDLSAGGWGGFAEYVCAREDELTLKPSGMTFEQAAAIPQAGLLALQGLLKGQLQQEQTTPAQKILINGASGGSGTIAVQIAKSFGAEVTGVCSTNKMDLVRSLGADHVIDYTQEDFTKNGQQYDLIIDAQAHHSIFDYKRALSPGGHYVGHGGASSRMTQIIFLGPLISMFGSKKLSLLMHEPNKDFALMKELFETGKVVPVIDKSYPLSEAIEAMRYYGEGNARGKVILTMEEDS